MKIRDGNSEKAARELAYELGAELAHTISDTLRARMASCGEYSEYVLEGFLENV